MRINHNIAALNTYRQLTMNNVMQQKSLEKLSSGLRINRAGDDAAGLAISEKMRSQIRGLEQASRNAQDGISLIQTAEGGLNEVHSILQRMRELAVQAASDTNTADDRAEIQKEISQLIDEINRISSDTEFNTKKLLNGSLSKNASSVGVDSSSQAYISAISADSTATSGTTTLSFDTTTGVLEAAQETITATGDLNGDTAVTDTTKLTTLSAFSDLQIGDVITIKAKVGGELVESTLNVTGDTTFGDFKMAIQNTITGSTVTTVTGSGTNNNDALQIAGQKGAAYAITDISITAKDSTGTIDRTSFNSAMSFTQSQVAGDAGDVLVSVGTSYSDANGVAVRNDETFDNLIEGVSIRFQNLDANFLSSDGNIDVIVTKVNKSATLQIGSNEGQSIRIDINGMSAKELGISDINVTTQAGANSAITVIDNAIITVSAERSKLGAFQNRLEHTINNLGTSAENLAASESRIRDVDMAKEMMEFTKMNILSQAAQAMLAQANQLPQGVLQLLR